MATSAAGVVLITGASSGIGEAVAREYARRGWKTVLLARRVERIAALAQELGGDGHSLAVACDVTHRISYDRNRVMLRVPRSCLGAPRWVQVGIRSTVAGATFAYADDARSNGLPSGLQSSLVLGPRIPL